MSNENNATDAALPIAIMLMGPTASGKSQIALELAQQYPVEIVSVDSAQVYRYMDIGTAKPDREILARTPHHLINLIDPTDRYSAAQFRGDALETMHAVIRRGRIPLLVGGTMLYFRALLDGLSALPQANAKLRAEIEMQAQAIGWPAMHKKLGQLDAVSATRIKPTDSQRIQRALEVCILSNRPMSEMLQTPKDVDLPFRVIKLVLQPSDRSQLHRQIAVRFEQMLCAGLVDEVLSLRQQFDLKPDLPSMRCVGYRQVWLYLEKEIDLKALHAMGIAATRQLAKRQLTWLRSIMCKADVYQLDCLASDLSRQVRSVLDEAI